MAGVIGGMRATQGPPHRILLKWDILSRLKVDMFILHGKLFPWVLQSSVQSRFVEGLCVFLGQIPSSALYKYLSAPIKYIAKENNKSAKLHTTVNDKHNAGGGIVKR